VLLYASAEIAGWECSVTGFGGFDNSTCERVLDLLELRDLRLREVVVKRVAVVELGVNSESSDGGRCFEIDTWIDTAEMTNMITAGFGDR